ncbi:glycosyltransferase [Amylibacter sp.]|nr:glycosyltransferase [Amylibacter sp.]
MSDLPTVSLVIVSRKRQTSLRRTLSALRFQSYENFEVIVVSDAKDGLFFADLPFSQNICHLQFDEPNISAARNIGIAAAHGQIVAFCDDDAVPDPCWLERLIAPFQDLRVGSAGGYVRGRNGIEFQWHALLCDDRGDDHQLEIDETVPFCVVKYDGVRFAKLQGTNCAFRKDALEQVGGFDEGYRFFLDETELCLRLAKAGYHSAFVPFAQVHHGFAASEQRSDARVPKTLFDLGASKKRFLTNHADEVDHARSATEFVQNQHARLVQMMVDGRVEPRDVKRLLETLQDGFDAPLTGDKPLQNAVPERGFVPFGHFAPASYKVFGGSTLLRQKLLGKAMVEAKRNHPVVVMLFSITSLFHRRDYDVRGFWVQSGGIFGKSNRLDPIFRTTNLRDRIKSEFERLRVIFPGTELWIVKMFGNFVLEKTKSDDS